MNFQPFCYQPEVVFEGRNKAYGAYSMRKIYEKRILISVALAIFAFSIGMGGPVLYNTFGPAEKVEQNFKPNVTTKIPPPPKKKMPPPPEITPPPPPKQKATIKFPPPVPADVKEDEIPPIKQTKGKAISTTTTDGEEDKGDPTPPPVDKKPVDLPLEPPKTDDKIYQVVQQQPAFEGDMGKYMKRNFKYPKRALQQGIEGNVFVSFVVRKDGTIDDVKLLKGLADCSDCNDEAIRLVKNMPPWTPGKQNGNAVNVSFRLPIKFNIQ